MSRSVTFRSITGHQERSLEIEIGENGVLTLPERDVPFGCDDLPALWARFIELQPVDVEPTEIPLPPLPQLAEMIEGEHISLYSISCEALDIEQTFLRWTDGAWMIGGAHAEEATLQSASSLQIWLLLCDVAAGIEKSTR